MEHNKSLLEVFNQDWILFSNQALTKKCITEGNWMELLLLWKGSDKMIQMAFSSFRIAEYFIE